MTIKRIKNWQPPNQIKAVLPKPANREERRADVKFYQSPAWRSLRASVLREQPMCAKPGCTEIARHVHHVKPRKQFPDLALERSNLEGLCIPHHNAEDER